jgi:hypothetical protein
MEATMAKFDGDAWFKWAQEIGAASGGWHEIKPKTPEWDAWQTYFNDLGWTPYTFKNVEFSKARSWTAPCRWPLWLTDPPAQSLGGGTHGLPPRATRSLTAR